MKLIATGNSVKKYHGRSTEQISQLGRNSENGILMVAIFIKKQKQKYFGHLKRSEGLGKIVLKGKIGGKRERKGPRRQ